MSSALGVAVGVPVGLTAGVRFGVVAAFGVAAAFYMAWVWHTIWDLDAGETAFLAAYEDPTRATADLLLLGAAVASLVAVGLVLADAPHDGSAKELLHVGVGLGSVVLSWALVHTVFTLRYARMYYGKPGGGIEFREQAPPVYSDFAYLSFTIGMTFQVSDTDLESVEIRRTALRHALLSFLFCTGILAATINLVASLSTG